MTAQRPNVVVYQEYATLTVTPDIPDLNVLIVGTAKQLLDYLDDKAECYATEYGTFQGNCPMVDPIAVAISDPPSIAPGGILDSTSVAIYLDAAQVVIVESGVLPGATEGLYTLGDNLFKAHTTAGGVHFGGEEVAPGDVLIVESPGGPTVDNYVMTVKELCYTLHAYAGGVDFQAIANPVQAGDTLTLFNDTVPLPAISRNGTYTVKRVIDSATLEVVSASWQGRVQTAVPNTVDILIVDNTGAPRISAAAVALADYCNLRVTSDFVGSAAPGTSRPWRVERKVSDLLLDATDFVVVDNSITLDPAITVDLSLTLLGKKVSYGQIYVEYAAFRTDLQTLTTLSNYSEMEVLLGKYDARNPLMVGAVVAKANTSTPVKIYGVPDNTLPDYLEFLDRISTERDVYAIVPLITGAGSTSILAALKSSCENLADPTYVLDHGIKQKFRVVIGSLELVTSKFLTNSLGTGGGVVAQKSATAPTAIRQFTLSTGGTGLLPDFFSIGLGTGLLPGDTVIVHQAAPLLNYTLTVAQVNDNLIFESDEDSPWGGALALTGIATDYIQFRRGGVVLATFTVAAVTFPDLTLTAAALDNLYLVLSVPTATFITSGVIPGDVLQIPENPTINNWSGTERYWVIDDVISNQTLRIVNRGSNTSVLETELPHGGRRTDGTEITSSQYCRILRNMDKTQQVSELVAVAQSFTSKRTVLCFPDEVVVTSLVDGSEPRITDPTKPEAAGAQPGYYLSCAVGGQTAGQPPQQGFTNLGIAGIDQIFNSSDYFSEEQLTNLSNGGVYVFVQENPSALPVTIHEVTTDVSALEFSEYMVIKDFDFVAWTFLDTLLPFLGIWNVTPDTIEFIRQALFTTGNNLRARKVAKIGAPLINYQLDSVAQSTLSKDRIEADMQVNLPMTLNVIGLHLVA